jgi:hypothetical protein
MSYYQFYCIYLFNSSIFSALVISRALLPGVHGLIVTGVSLLPLLLFVVALNLLGLLYVASRCFLLLGISRLVSSVAISIKLRSNPSRLSSRALSLGSMGNVGNDES